MPAGDSVPALTAALVEMNAQLDHGIELEREFAKVRADAAAASSAGTEKKRRELYGPDWQSGSDLGEAAAGKMNTGNSPSGTSAVPSAPGLNPFSTDVLDAEGFKAGSYKAANKATAAYDLQVAKSFEDFANGIDSATGKQTYIGAGFRQLAQFVREGRFSGTDASRYAQAIFQNFAKGAMEEAADPTSSPQLRNFDAEFLRFLSSGLLQPTR